MNSRIPSRARGCRPRRRDCRGRPTWCFIAAAAVLAAPPGAWAGDRFELIDAPARPRPTTRAATAPSGDGDAADAPISRALILLNTEARQLAKDGKIDIRLKPDFAKRKNLRVASAEVLRVMGTSLHRDPVLDAYVKWQLLSFEPDIENAASEQIDRILNNAPGLMPVPQVGADVERTVGRASSGLQVEAGLRTTRQRTIVLGYETTPGSKVLKPKVAVLREGMNARAGGASAGGAAVERHGGPNLEVSRQDLMDIRQRAAAVNAQVAAFRDALLAALPVRHGARVSAMMHDLADRIRAGDRSVDRASDRMTDELRKQTKAGVLDGPTRLRLIDQLADLGAMRVEVIRAIAQSDDQGIDFDTTIVQLPKGDYRTAMDLLEKADTAPGAPGATRAPGAVKPGKGD